MIAVLDNDLQEFKKLIELGAEVNIKDDYGNTALMLAVSKNRTVMVKLLLEIKGIVFNIHCGPGALSDRRLNNREMAMIIESHYEINLKKGLIDPEGHPLKKEL